MRSNTVAAVVVTYNRVALLQECIAALRVQTRKVDGIIVINNSSTDGTEAWLKEQQDIFFVTQENRGGSFGFYTGIKTGFEQGYEWIWCMDDDGRPDNKALEELMNYKHRKPCLMNGLVLDSKDSNRIVFKTGTYTVRSDIREETIEGDANPYNSTMYHTDIIKIAGWPRSDLVIWGDETEYFNRIKYKHHLPVFTVVNSLHFHPVQFSQFYKREWDMSSFGWKVFFYIRNKRFVFRAQYNSRVRSLLVYSRFLLIFFATIIVYQKRERWKKLRLLYKGAQDGFRNNTAKDINNVRKLIQKL